MYGSPRVKINIEKLAKKATTARYGILDWEISGPIKQLFDIIEGKNQVDSQDKIIADLIDRIERMALINKIEDMKTKTKPSIEHAAQEILGKSEYRTKKFQSAGVFIETIVEYLSEESRQKGNSKASYYLRKIPS